MENKSPSTSWTCAQCDKEFYNIDFKIKSLIFKDKWVCEDCAIHEDQIWLENIDRTKYTATGKA